MQFNKIQTQQPSFEAKIDFCKKSNKYILEKSGKLDMLKTAAQKVGTKDDTIKISFHDKYSSNETGKKVLPATVKSSLDNYSTTKFIYAEEYDGISTMIDLVRKLTGHFEKLAAKK